MAASLDDSIIIDDPGPPVVLEQLEQLERHVGATLPSSLRRALLEHNGGRPDPKTFEVKGHPERLFDIQLFFGITGSPECETIAWNHREFPEISRQGFVPFGRTDTGDLLLLDRRDGSVVFWDSLEELPEQRYYRIADSHAAFLASLFEEDQPGH